MMIEQILLFLMFAGQTDEGVHNLLSRIEDMAFNLQPSFVTLTWQSHFKVCPSGEV